MLRLTFRVPFLATSIVRKLADDYKDTHPDAYQFAVVDFYVNYLITRTDLPERVTFLRASLNDRLSKAGMLLTKWCSSSSAVMDTIPEFFKESEPLQIILKLTKPYESIGIPVKMCYISLSQYCRFLSCRPNVTWSLPLPGCVTCQGGLPRLTSRPKSSCSKPGGFG